MISRGRRQMKAVLVTVVLVVLTFGVDVMEALTRRRASSSLKLTGHYFATPRRRSFGHLANPDLSYASWHGSRSMAAFCFIAVLIILGIVALFGRWLPF